MLPVHNSVIHRIGPTSSWPHDSLSLFYVIHFNNDHNFIPYMNTHIHIHTCLHESNLRPKVPQPQAIHIKQSLNITNQTSPTAFQFAYN